MIPLFVIASIASYAVAFAVAIGLLALQDWFGSGDLQALAFWTAPLAVGIGLLALPVSRLRRTIGVPLAVVGGPALGFAFTFMVAVFLGPWFGAFSFPPLYCWMAAALTGLLVAALAPGSRLTTGCS